MRIAYVVHDYNWTWGHARYTAEIASRISEKHEVHVFSNTADRKNSDRIQFHSIPALRSNALSTILSFSASAAWLVRGSFDIIHSQGYCGGPHNFITAHQCNAEWHAARRRATQNQVGWREKVFGRVVEKLEGDFYRQAKNSHVIAISGRIRDDLRKHYQCPSEISVLYHGTDTKRFHPGLKEIWRQPLREKFGVSPEEFLFLHLGDLRKGAEQELRALREIPSAKLLLVYRGDAAQYQAIAAELGLGDRVVFAGPTEEPERFFAAADAFVCATPYDPFALVITEAMACALPVIASRWAGAAELIEHGRNGIILDDPTDFRELSRHMRSLVDKHFDRKELGRAARASVESRTWDEVAQETLALYEKHLQNPPAGNRAGARP